MGRVLGGAYRIPAGSRDDQINREVDELRRQSGQTFRITLCVAEFDEEIATFDVTEISQCLPERFARI